MAAADGHEDVMPNKQKFSAVPVQRIGPPMLVFIGMAVMLLACLQALDFPFISDDNVYVTNNLPLRELQLSELWRLFVQPFNPYEFLPLRDFSYWLDMTLFGLSPSAMRIENIVLYLLGCLLVYGTTLQVWRYFNAAQAASARWAAATVTALFAIHPAHVEAVVWISGRKDVLAGLLSMLALWLALQARANAVLIPRYAAASVFALIAAMLAKATAVVVAPVIALLWLMYWRDLPAVSRNRSWLLWIVALLFTAGCALLLFTAHSQVKEPVYWGVETATRAAAILGWMLRLALSPEGQHFFYPVFDTTWLPAMVVPGIAVLLAAAAGVWMLLRRRSLEGFALVAFVLLCLPYLQLVPYGTHTLVSDRFMFLAVWPVLLLLVALAWRLRAVPRIALLLLVALPWIYHTVERPRDWRSFDLLVEADVRAYPEYFMAASCKVLYVQLTHGLYRDARETASHIAVTEVKNMILKQIDAEYAVYVDAAANGKADTAMARLRDFGRVLQQRPMQARWDLSMKRIWGRGEQALAELWQMLAQEFPSDMSVHYNAGLSLIGIHSYEAAAAHLRAAVDSQRLPDFVRGSAYKNLGVALLNSGHAAAAEVALRAALNEPHADVAAYCSLAEIYRRAGRSDEAAHAETECLSRVLAEKIVR